MNIISTQYISDPQTQMPLVGGHLDFLQNNTRTMDNAIVNGISQNNLYSPNPVIVAGCSLGTITGGTTTLLQGYIYEPINNELFYVPQTTFTGTIPSSGVTFSATTTYSAPLDPLEFSDGNFYNVSQIRVLTAFTGTTGLFTLNNAQPLRGTWTSIIGPYNNYTGSTHLGCKLNTVSNRVELSGNIKNTWNNLNTVGFTLPTNMRVKTSTLASVPYIVTTTGGTSYNSTSANFQTNGDVEFFQISGYSNTDLFTFYLDSISLQIEN